MVPILARRGKKELHEGGGCRWDVGKAPDGATLTLGDTADHLERGNRWSGKRLFMVS